MKYKYYKLEDFAVTTNYPSGESHTRLNYHPTYKETPESLVIEAQVFSFSDLCRVIAVNRVYQHKFGTTPKWFIPFFPFARDDRRNNDWDSFELQLAIDMVRRENLDITILDPHSDVSGVLKHIPQSAVVEKLRHTWISTTNYRNYLLGSDVICIPDIGASKKAGTWIDDNPYVQCLKHRDILTGKLSGFEVLTDDLKGADCFIMDDICDGGGTFLGLAQKLKEKGAGKLTLGVSHGLFTAGFEALNKAFDQIVCFGPKEYFGETHNVIPYSSLYDSKTV